MAGRKREPAIRMFASEYNSSNLETKAEEEYAPSYLISPLGAMVNRVYFIGVLTEKENIGNEAEPLWRARVKDPTGTFFLSAGSYQPEASQSIRELDPPVLVAVVGKIRTFTTDEGGFYVSVRPERVTSATKDQRDYWIYQAAVQTRARMGLYQKAVDQEELTPENLVANAEMDDHQAQGIVDAISHYGVVDIQGYKEAVLEALNFIVTGKESGAGAEMSAGDIIDHDDAETRPDEGYDALTGSGDDAAGPDAAQELDMEVVNVGDDEEEEPEETLEDVDASYDATSPSDSADAESEDAADPSEHVQVEEEPEDEEQGEEETESESGGEEETESESDGEEEAESGFGGEEETEPESGGEEETEPESGGEEETEPESGGEEEGIPTEPEGRESPEAEGNGGSQQMDAGEDQPDDGFEETQEGIEAEVVETEEETTGSEEDSKDAEGLEQRICQAIKDLASGPRGASYHEVQEKLEGEGVGKTEFEEAVNLLLDKGIIYEPSVNRINVVNY